MKTITPLLLVGLIWLSGLPVLGQACFKAYDAQSGQEINTFCVGQRVRLKSCDPNSRPDQEYYDFDKSNQVQFPDTSKYHVYTAPGTYTVTQLINSGSGGVTTEKTFRVLANPIPEYTATSCSQRNVKVTITDRVYDFFEVHFAGGPTRTLSQGGTTTYQFPPGQPMQVTVRGKLKQAICSNAHTTTIQELPAAPQPRLTKIALMQPAPNVRISFILEQLHPDYNYLIEKQTGTSFVPVDTIKNPTSGQMTRTLSLNNAQDQGCYRIRAVDDCQTSTLSFSNTVCSLPLSARENQGIELSWPAYPDQAQLKAYQLYKNDRLHQELANTQLSFHDKRVPCQQQTCYRVVAILHNGAHSESNAPCLSITTSPPPATPFLESTFTADNRIQVRLQVPASQVIRQITYQKSTSGSAFTEMVKNANTSIEDNSFARSAEAFCYQAFYQDSCSQTSPTSNQTCPVVLKASQQDNIIMLSWSLYSGMPGEQVQYLVEKLDANGRVLSSVAVSGNSYRDQLAAGAEQKTWYRIQGRRPGKDPTYSNTLQVVLESSILIPTAFSPNGDRLNDLFEVKGRFARLRQLRIYDRWGQVIYQSEGQGWDGRIKGQEAPAGSYPYSVSWEDQNGAVFTRNGIVSLIR